MTKAELIDKISSDAGITKHAAGNAVESMIGPQRTNQLVESESDSSLDQAVFLRRGFTQ